MTSQTKWQKRTKHRWFHFIPFGNGSELSTNMSDLHSVISRERYVVLEIEELTTTTTMKKLSFKYSCMEFERLRADKIVALSLSFSLSLSLIEIWMRRIKLKSQMKYEIPKQKFFGLLFYWYVVAATACLFAMPVSFSWHTLTSSLFPSFRVRILI